MLQFQINLFRILSHLNLRVIKTQGELYFEYNPTKKKSKIQYINELYKPAYVVAHNNFRDKKR